jgi:hypothetical protein
MEIAKGFYNGLKRGAACFIVGLGLMGLAGCASVPLVVIKEKTPYVENVPDKLLLTDRVILRDYYQNKVAFTADIGTEKDPNIELFIANKDGSDQIRLTYNSDMELPPSWTENGEIVYESFEGYYLINPTTGNRREITKEFYESVINKKK